MTAKPNMPDVGHITQKAKGQATVSELVSSALKLGASSVVVSRDIEGEREFQKSSKGDNKLPEELTYNERIFHVSIFFGEDNE